MTLSTCRSSLYATEAMELAARNHPAADAVAFDDVPVGRGVQRGRNLIDQGGQIGAPADLGKLALSVELFAQRQQIDRDALLMQARVRLPDPPVAVDMEIVGLQELRDVVVDLGINEHRPHDCFFGFPIVRNARR